MVTFTKEALLIEFKTPTPLNDLMSLNSALIEILKDYHFYKMQNPELEPDETKIFILLEFLEQISISYNGNRDFLELLESKLHT